MNLKLSITIEVQNEFGETKTLSLKSSGQENVADALGEALSWTCVQSHGEDWRSQGVTLGEAFNASLIISKDRVAKEAWLNARANVLGWAGDKIEEEAN